MRRWSLRNAVIAVVLMAGTFALERLLSIDPTDALVDAILIGFIGFAILQYWRD